MCKSLVLGPPFLKLEGSFFVIFQILSMNEQEINDLFRRIRNEKIKNLENRKRKASNNGTSNSGSIGKKKYKPNEDDSVQIVSSSSHDTKSNDRDSKNKDVENELVEDNNGSLDPITDLLESIPESKPCLASESGTRPNTPKSNTRPKAPESNPESSTMPNTPESNPRSNYDPWGLDRSTKCSGSTWGSWDQINVEVTPENSQPPTRPNTPISNKDNKKTYPTSESSN